MTRIVAIKTGPTGPFLDDEGHALVRHSGPDVAMSVDGSEYAPLAYARPLQVGFQVGDWAEMCAGAFNGDYLTLAELIALGAPDHEPHTLRRKSQVRDFERDKLGATESTGHADEDQSPIPLMRHSLRRVVEGAFEEWRGQCCDLTLADCFGAPKPVHHKGNVAAARIEGMVGHPVSRSNRGQAAIERRRRIPVFVCRYIKSNGPGQGRERLESIGGAPGREMNPVGLVGTDRVG